MHPLKEFPVLLYHLMKKYSLNDLDPSAVLRYLQVTDPSDKWENLHLGSCCVFNELPLEPCDNEVILSSSIDLLVPLLMQLTFLRRHSTLEHLLSVKLPDECDDANSIWSIFTDKLLYCQSDNSDSVRHFAYDSLKAENAKQRFFDAALNNESCLGTFYIDSCNIAELYRDQLYDAVPISNKKT